MEFLNDVLIAAGGGIVVTLGIFTIFKNMALNVFEKSVGTAFEKRIESFRNELNRSTIAYEMLLDREMSYYKSVEPLYAELIVNVQDLVFWFEQIKEEKHVDVLKSVSIRYLELIKELKNESLKYHTYVPKLIFKTSTDVISTMQSNIDFWSRNVILAFDGKYNELDLDTANKISDDILAKIAIVETNIRERLLELSGVEDK